MNEVRDVPARSRYELLVDGEIAGIVEYTTRPGTLVLVHTETDPAHQGEGLGAALVRGVLSDVRTRGLTIVPQCPFVARYLDEHPEWRDLVVPDPSTANDAR